MDRLAARLHLLLTAVAALMLALTVGATVLVYDAENARATDQQTRTHTVTATIHTDTDTTGTGTPVRPAARVESRTGPVLAAATWHWAGDTRTGTIELPASVSADTHTSILVDSSGNWAGPAITGTDIVGNTTAALIGALTLATVLLAGLHTWSTRILDRHRQRYWDEALHRLFATYGR